MTKTPRKIWHAVRPELRKILMALFLVVAVTLAMFALLAIVGVSRGSVAFLIPVVVAAIRWGFIAAIAAAIGGVIASVFFFYAPIYDFRISGKQIVDLALYVFVALTISRLAAQLSAARVRAESQVLRQALIDSVSHELRTPLASILGSASVLTSTPAVADDIRLRGLAHGIREEAERLDRDIQNLLDASRVTAKGIKAHAEAADPADIVNSALARCRRRLANHAVETDIAIDLPFIDVDMTLVVQALVQILDNAAKYSPAGSTIRIAARAGRYGVAISVRDDGRGLTPVETNNMWNRQFRGDQVGRISGSGLGLWIAKAFVNANNGRVAAVSDGPGLGTTITMTLPISGTDTDTLHSALDKHDE